MAKTLPSETLRTWVSDLRELLVSGEPFRLFFPLGAVFGILGAVLWPLYSLGLAGYPGPAHSRIMVEAFLTAFVMGFLGTAFPRMLDAPALGLPEIAGCAAGLVLVSVFHTAGQGAIGDGVFLATLGLFVFALARRFLKRKDLPPPSFVLAGMGLVSGLAGVVLQLAAPHLEAGWAVLGRLLLHQGYLLLPVMGVGAFLFPRFVGLPNRQDFPESLSPTPGWIRKAAWAAVAGGLVWTGYFLEAFGDPRAGIALRAVVVPLYLLGEVPFQRARIGKSSLALGLCVAIVSIPLGHALMAVFPGRMLSWLHVVFITGFGLLALIVACRVVYGHGGHSEKFSAVVKPVLVVIGLVVLAMLTRVSADWMPESRMRHLAYAALAWIAGLIIWAYALPGLWRPLWRAASNFFGVQLDEVGVREKLIASAGGVLSIALVLMICHAAFGAEGAFLLIPSMGATAVLLFAVPHGPMSQPWPVLGGHILSAVLGVACAKGIPFLPLAAGCAVGFSIAAMHFLKCLHPPGGATALTAVVGGHGVWALGYSFVGFPVALNAVLMVAIAVALGAAFGGRRYPHRPQVSGFAGLSHEAVVSAVRGMETFVDISEADLIELHRKLNAEEDRRKK